MKRNTVAVRLISTTLVAALGSFSILPAAAIASTNESAPSFGESSIVKTSDNTFSVIENGHESTVTVTEADGTRTVAIVDSATGESNQFIYDEATDTIYSSYTGKTINADDITEVNTPSTRSRSTSKTYSFSYASIKSAVGDTGNIVSMIGFFLSKTGALSMDAGPVITLGVILSGIGGLIPNQSDHGINVTVTTTKYYRNGNNVPYRTTKTITGLSAY